MSGSAFGLSNSASYLFAPVIRMFNWGERQAARDRDLAVHSPLLAVLGTEHDTPRDWLQAGQALARVLLTACLQEISASFLNQPIQVTDLRSKLCAMIHRAGFPQLLLRMGYGPEVPPTPRRLASEVLR